MIETCIKESDLNKVSEDMTPEQRTLWLQDWLRGQGFIVERNIECRQEGGILHFVQPHLMINLVEIAVKGAQA